MVKTIAKNWYRNLDQAKITGQRCKNCGSYNFPPITACKNCRGRDLEEVEMSGEGELIMFSSTMLPAAKFSEEPKGAYGIVKLKEGPVFLTKVDGFDISSPEAIQKENEALPVKVKAKIVKAIDTNIVIFEKA
jgi:uncharacterized OB-fold protein